MGQLRKWLLLFVVVSVLLSSEAVSSLTKLYNTRVRWAQRVERPIIGLSRRYGPIRHAGVLVTTVDGKRWLVHKGNEYGQASQTVVVDARWMSGWTYLEKKRIYHSTVGDYVRKGGRHYNVILDNCLHAAYRMMKLD